MRVGVFRSDMPETFHLEPSQFVRLLEEWEATMRYFVTGEEGLSMDVIDMDSFNEQLWLLKKQLKDLCDPELVWHQLISEGRPEISYKWKDGARTIDRFDGSVFHV